MKNFLRLPSAFALALFILVPSDAVASRLASNALYATALLGSTASLVFWYPQAVKAVNTWGFMGATASTHTLRVGIDLLAISACVNGLYQTNKNK